MHLISYYTKKAFIVKQIASHNDKKSDECKREKRVTIFEFTGRFYFQKDFFLNLQDLSIL
jgi:hypothetical protein